MLSGQDPFIDLKRMSHSLTLLYSTDGAAVPVMIPLVLLPLLLLLTGVDVCVCMYESLTGSREDVGSDT